MKNHEKNAAQVRAHKLRHTVAAALGEQFPALYALWAEVQEDLSVPPERSRSGAPIFLDGRTIPALAHVLGLPQHRLTRRIAVFDRMLDRAMNEERIVDTAERIVAAQEARVDRPDLAGVPARRVAGTGVTVTYQGGCVERDREFTFEPNLWDAPIFDTTFAGKRSAVRRAPRHAGAA